MNKAIAKLNNLKIAPRKVRLVSNLIKGQSVNVGLTQLQMMPWRSAPEVAKLVKSAVANARSKNMNVEKLIIESITVDEGPMLKRFLPRAMGRATPIHKKMSHLTVILDEKEGIKPKYTIHESPKKTKRVKKERDIDKQKFQKEKVANKEARPGFFQKLFNRKAI